ncbi:DUF1127 domain-containing protein [Neptunomonas phycophila]|jgi:uncharacterized protein YjiS (DUF1127 family)|uniref:DUF1127 domain-containing protein n=1 Tax=Neptunomonas phycophila TaxID=1572645 RepID=A0AAW7XCN9_9GAMM|nr:MULTISPECIES: DUF1127 domain-containing protein [Neptunomonas]MBT3146195.1 DUF1127 domain-containing protein [Neptunomonas phycophila]MDN2659629.1 DUF1127 domain-containing protein [Neptunomonas sp. CHC150]MDO6452171.1 DUF1127 domain-containing protein [Neptunomonas phycophila]MDO6466724.1 DUF1127 domain-containing protein [Neptunomonas phycophila]MDO6783135.1 DUF1127 domain-containing protein [Neptunomonas phycophila]
MVIIGLVKRVVDECLRLLNRQRTRRQLLLLDQTSLKDIGLSRSDALKEGTKPMWRS